MIEAILPSCVVSVDTFEDITDEMLFHAEETVIKQAVDKRRREFTTARACARKAMALLGKPPAPVLPGVRGEPQWPDGIIGSITHCADYRGAVLGEDDKVTSIGIDAEPNQPLPNGVLQAIGLPPEQEQVTALLAGHPQVRWDRLLFCAKESVYKAWYPLTDQWLNFEDAHITLDPDGTFSAQLLVTGPRVHGRRLTGFSGRWIAGNGLILTAIVVPVPAARS